MEEHFDVLDKEGHLTGKTKPRSAVHRDGDFHRAVHVWILAESTNELLLQKRADHKDSWPGMWDISSAGHISAGDSSIATARRELEEELGIALPADALEFLFEYLQNDVLNNGTFINHEYNDVYLVTTLEPIPQEAFTLQESEVSAVKYMPLEQYIQALQDEDPAYVVYDVDGPYGKLFELIKQRYSGASPSARSEKLQKQLSRFVPVTLSADLSGLEESDRAALSLLVEAAKALDEAFLQQVWGTNPSLKAWLEGTAGKEGASPLDKLKLAYYNVNKGPWSKLDEDEAFLTTADAPAQLASGAVQPVPGFKGVQYRAAFPMNKPPGANFYPPDMTRQEFETWKATLTEERQKAATSFFTVIRRPAETAGSEDPVVAAPAGEEEGWEFVDRPKGDRDLVIVKYSVEYEAALEKAAGLLEKAADVTTIPSLKTFLSARAKALLTNDYHDSDLSWMDLDSPIDVTIGPYETYLDGLYSYKATFEAFVGVRDAEATEKVSLFGHHLQELEDNLPLADEYKSKDVGSGAPIRVIQLAFNAGDVAGPQTVAFNLPNDERIVKERGTAMVMLKNVSQAKFDHILVPIAKQCLGEGQAGEVDFSSFFTHTLCHECCHGIGPHSIITPDGRQSTVRKELQEVYSAVEEAKADIVGLWALHFLLDKGLLPRTLERSMYTAFLAGCLRSVRFGLTEAHGKGQAVQFNHILEKGGFVELPDGSLAVDHSKVRGVVEDLSREILTVQAKGDKAAAKALLNEYGVLSPTLQRALHKLDSVQVPVDIRPQFVV